MSDWLSKKLLEFVEKRGYIPRVFQPYNCADVSELAPTVTASCGGSTTVGALYVFEGLPVIPAETETESPAIVQIMAIIQSKREHLELLRKESDQIKTEIKALELAISTIKII